MSDLGKILIVMGGLMVLAGLIFILFARTNIPLGRLPGDIIYRRKNSTIYFPLATSIIVSVVLSFVFYVIGRFRR